MDGAEKAAWSHSVRNWESSLQNLNLRATSKGEIETQPLRGQESHCGAARCVSVFHREDVGWWRSWLQQSYQAVKEKVS